MLPSKAYDKQVAKGSVVGDVEQMRFLPLLDQLYYQLKPRSRWRNIFVKKPKPIRGLYFWGSVGSGKTFLCDLLLQNLPQPKVWRTHFHMFMEQMHDQLQQYKNSKEPVQKVVKQLANQYSVVFIDEFFVVDIGDAMILARLLQALFKRGIVVVLTSNIAVDQLYLDGLQRERFLPTIRLIKKQFHICHLDLELDYRLRYLNDMPHYFVGQNAELQLQRMYVRLSDKAALNPDKLEVLGRQINYLALWRNTIWFDFNELCNGPRSQRDYVAIARRYQIVLLSALPQLTEDDIARRFVYLVDALYDQKVRLIIAADVAISDLYRGYKLQREFERTTSRLLQGTERR